MIGPTAAKKLPSELMMTGVRLEVARTPDAHVSLAEETKAFLADSNIDSVIVTAPKDTQSVIIKPEPLHPEKPVNKLTNLAKSLKKSGCIVHFHTGHYLTDIGTFNAVPKKELGGETSLSLPWSELADDGPLETLTMHEVRHFHQHRARTASRNGSGPKFRPDIRIKFEEGKEPDNWVGRQQAYNGVAGHTTDEVDAYLYQSKLHLKRAKRKSKSDPALARVDARKAITCACKAQIFASTDAEALRMDSPTALKVEQPWSNFLGETLLSEDGVGLFLSGKDFPEGDVLQNLHKLADELTQDGHKARLVAGEALKILSTDPGAVEAIEESIKQIKAAGWMK
jgi:hypothetical protein